MCDLSDFFIRVVFSTLSIFLVHLFSGKLLNNLGTVTVPSREVSLDVQLWSEFTELDVKLWSEFTEFTAQLHVQYTCVVP